MTESHGNAVPCNHIVFLYIIISLIPAPANYFSLHSKTSPQYVFFGGGKKSIQALKVFPPPPPPYEASVVESGLGGARWFFIFRISSFLV